MMVENNMNEEDLFSREKRIIQEAENQLNHGAFTDQDAAGLFSGLLGQYKKLYKQVKRLIRASDRMQSDLNQLNARLRHSEEKYRNIFENAAEGIFQSRLDGSFFKVNSAMARIFKYDTPEQMIGSIDLGGGSPFISSNERDRLIESIMANNRISSFQLEMRRRDGERFWVEISACAIEDHQGHATHIEGLLSDITLRKRLHEELKHLATMDGLTGLYNRRSFIEILNDQFHRARRESRPLSLLMIDADRFKSINDTYGHDMGDHVLRSLARICRNILRDSDAMGRLGGEEFAVVLPDIEIHRAGQVAERLRKAVAETSFSADHPRMKVTISIGVSCLDPRTPNGETLISCADRALYQAKRTTRNAVCFMDLASHIPKDHPKQFAGFTS